MASRPMSQPDSHSTLDLLILLVERHRQLVWRADIVKRLWDPGVFVDVEMGVNTAMRKLRQALQDSRESPEFVETISGKGYRFIAPVTTPLASTALQNSAQSESRIMLAVLPFENFSKDPSQEYFSDGLTEETISYLGRMTHQQERQRDWSRTRRRLHPGKQCASGRQSGPDHLTADSS